MTFKVVVKEVEEPTTCDFLLGLLHVGAQGERSVKDLVHAMWKNVWKASRLIGMRHKISVHNAPFRLQYLSAITVKLL